MPQSSTEILQFQGFWGMMQRIISYKIIIPIKGERTWKHTGLLMRTCTQCGRIFFASDSRSSLCSERCRKASKKAAKKGFDDKSKEEVYEQAYKREYMFWYNRIKKLEKNHAPQEQIQSAKAALKQFRKEAVERKNQIQNGELSTMQFMNWMIGQEPIIQKICGE